MDVLSYITRLISLEIHLKLLDQTLDGPLGKAFRLAALAMAHQAVHDAEAGIGARWTVAGHLPAVSLRLGSATKEGGLGQPFKRDVKQM